MASRLTHILRLTCYASAAALALTGAFLAGPARARMDSWTAGLVLAHLGLGVLLAPACLGWAIMSGVRGRGSGVSTDKTASRLLQAAGIGLLAAAFFTGATLIGAAARGGTASELVLDVHAAAGFTAVALVGSVLIRRRGSPIVSQQIDLQEESTSNPGPSTGGRLTLQAYAALVALLLVGLLAGSAAIAPGDGSDAHYQSDEYYADLTATNARQANNPLFPAGTTVVIEPGARVRSSAYCGAVGCHPDAYREWFGSAHQRSDIDPVFRRAAELFKAQRGGTARRWCEGCHGPAALAVAGRVARGQGSGVRGEPEVVSSPLTPHPSPLDEGVNCLTCHATERVTELSGNGRFELRVSSDYPFAEDPDPRRRWLHDFLLRIRPGPHRLAFMRPQQDTRQGGLRQSEFCASCHRMSYNLPQNDYKFLRTEDEYGTWQAGPNSGQSIHGFSAPGPVRRCQECHDAHGGSVPAFRHSGAQDERSRDAVLPALRSSMTVDLLAMRRVPRMAGAPEELVAPLRRAAPLLRPGETVTVDAVVRNRGCGHEFPAGVGNLNDAWLQFEVGNGAGRVLLRSGGLGPRGEIDPGAHTYGMIGLDRAGRRLEQGDLWNMITPLYYRPILPGQPDLDRRTIQPGESDVVRYRLRVPVGAVGPIRLRARLWRRRPSHGVVAGSTTGGSFVIAEDMITLPLAPEMNAGGQSRLASPRGVPVDRRAVRESTPGVTDPALPSRFYDYGVGLLLQGDLPRAQGAMRRVQAWAPGDVQGYLGLGRVYLTEGDLLAARAQFAQASHLSPDDPRPRAFLATTDRRTGQYDRALKELEPLVRDYPRDHLLWFDVGMCHYLSGRFEEAARAFQAMLDIDPDDLAAHYNLMRCLRRLHRLPEARQEEVIYQTLREDDGAKQIGLAYLRRHRLADREARTVHEHDLAPVTSNQ